MARDRKQTEHEVAVFELFLEAHPSFKAEISCSSPATGDFPDIYAKWKQGGSAGFELGEWLSAEQMAEGKRKQRLRTELSTALSQRKLVKPRHIKLIAIEVTEAKFAQ